jgi:hypothetical protein
MSIISYSNSYLAAFLPQISGKNSSVSHTERRAFLLFYEPYVLEQILPSVFLKLTFRRLFADMFI